MKRLLCPTAEGFIALHNAKVPDFFFSSPGIYFSLIHPRHFETTESLLTGIKQAEFFPAADVSISILTSDALSGHEN